LSRSLETGNYRAMRTSGTRVGNGVGSGDGWGGPARGAGTTERFTSENQPDHSSEAKLSYREKREKRAQEMEDVLYDIAIDDEQRSETRVQAAFRLHTIIEGQPVARTITAKVDDVRALSDAELRAEFEKLSREINGTIEGDASEEVSE